MYSPEVIDHHKNPRNVGMIKDADGVGTVGTPASGEMIKFWIRVHRGRIVSARFKAFGCPTVIAAGSRHGYHNRRGIKNHESAN